MLIQFEKISVSIVILIEIFVLIDSSRLDSKVQNRIKYYKLFKTIRLRVCDESTVDGVLSYDQPVLDQFNNCDKLEAGVQVIRMFMEYNI